jgi:hypothetical protein
MTTEFKGTQWKNDAISLCYDLITAQTVTMFQL